MTVLTPDETRKKILNLMDEKEITKRDLIDLLDEKGLDLYKFLSGKTKSIRSDRLALIAAVLDVDTNYLLYDTDSTGGRITLAGVADYLGLSASSVTFIRKLPDVPRLGLDSAMSKSTTSKRVRDSFLGLLQLIGEDVSSSVVSDRDYFLFRACRAVCDLLNRL